MAVSTDVSVLTMTKCLVNGELREAPGSFPVINPSTGTFERVCTRVLCLPGWLPPAVVRGGVGCLAGHRTVV